MKFKIDCMKFKIDLRYVGNCACDLFKENAKTLAAIAACWLIGLAVGVAVSVKIEDYAALNILEALKDGSFSASGTFFRCLALGAVGAAAAYLTAFKRQLAAISAISARVPYTPASTSPWMLKVSERTW